MIRTEIFRLSPGSLYRAHQLAIRTVEGNSRIEDVSGAMVRLEGFAFDGNTRRDLVVVTVLEGAEMGRLLVWTPYQFAIHHRPEVSQLEPSPVEQKIAGQKEGSGF